MKKKNRWRKPYGLRARFGLSLLVSGILCALLFCALYYGSDYILTEYFTNSAFEERHLQRQVNSLQDYLTEEQLSSEDLTKLKNWERKQPLSLLEIYADGDCIYSSLHTTSKKLTVSVLRDSVLDERYSFPLNLADRPATAVLYSDFTYKYYLLSITASFAVALLIFVLLFLRTNSRLIDYLCKLNGEVQIIEGGNLDHPVTVQGNDEIADLATSMNRMRTSFREQLETEQELHRANRRLVTEMSHDLRTPLTSLMLYTEILRTHRYETEEQLQEYLEKIDAKAHRMKTLSDHLFSYSLEGNPPNYQKPVTLEQALSDALEDMAYDLRAHGFVTSLELDWQPRSVQVKPESLSRILENIGSNIVKYASREEPVRIETFYQDGYCGVIFLNACTPEAAGKSGSGIGLENIRSMMEQMHGLCTVEETESAFELTLLFPSL